ncbi:hypothetical protein DFJ58DRAFT_847448 [Suillus subalutaceus]|uniref:uncharacterized protein n=1 Tax=Suillus subalutaceus TaxID=48586 RepID=UPI001B85C7D2|nr:uncharacterized protein DFJ58DRAFT_847448 [Suillus subalutaceus]KAG1835365.1 hypothetical protein DFJ58DRAFT_847448 [Suillus subalutaceus]
MTAIFGSTLGGSSPQEARYFLMNRWSFHQATLWLCVLSMSPWDLLNVTLVERPSVLYFTRSAQQTDHLDVTLVEHTPDLVRMPTYQILLYMTQQKPEMPSGVDQQPSPGPSYMGSSPASFDYVEEQFGGGRRYEAPPAELTPSRLRTRLKATVRDVGIVKDASARRQAYQNTSNDVQLSVGPFHHVVQDGASTSTSDTSSLTLNVAYSRHNSPFPPLQGPAQLQDLFYGPMDQQSPWMQQNPSGDFGMMQPDTFTAGLLGDQALGMAGAGDKSLWPAPSVTNVQDVKLPMRRTQPTLHLCLHTRLFIFPPVHLVSLSCLADVRWIHRQPSSELMQNSPFTLHPAPYVPPQIIQPFRVQPQTSSPRQHHSRMVAVTILLRPPPTAFGSLKRVSRECTRGSSGNWPQARGRSVNGTNITGICATLRRKCYEKFKDNLSRHLQDILSKHEEVAILSSSPQTIAQRGQAFQKTLRSVTSIVPRVRSARLDLKQPLYYVVKVVNEDGSLGHSYNTPGAGGLMMPFQKTGDDSHQKQTPTVTHDIDQLLMLWREGREDT